jgi:hypothetical protein
MAVREYRCRLCRRLLLPVVYEAGVCFGCFGLDNGLCFACWGLESEESSLERKRRLTRERVQRYRERKQGG